MTTSTKTARKTRQPKRALPLIQRHRSRSTTDKAVVLLRLAAELYAFGADPEIQDSCRNICNNAADNAHHVAAKLALEFLRELAGKNY